jgi:hypothetical protein
MRPTPPARLGARDAVERRQVAEVVVQGHPPDAECSGDLRHRHLAALAHRQRWAISHVIRASTATRTMTTSPITSTSTGTIGICSYTDHEASCCPRRLYGRTVGAAAGRTAARSVGRRQRCSARCELRSENSVIRSLRPGYFQAILPSEVRFNVTQHGGFREYTVAVSGAQLTLAAVEAGEEVELVDAELVSSACPVASAGALSPSPPPVPPRSSRSSAVRRHFERAHDAFARRVAGGNLTRRPPQIRT